MKLWGGRFSKEPDADFLKFSSSIETDSFLWREELLQNAAYVIALKKAGILEPEEERQVLSVLKKLYLNALSGNSFWFDEDEDIHSAVERALVQELGEVGHKVHTGRSRNEQIATDLRLYLKRKIVDINEGILALHKVLLEKAKLHIDHFLPGYTHLQRAQPVRLAHHLLAWFFMVKRDFDRFVSARKKMDFCPLGSGALAGNSFGLDRFFMAELLGFKAPTDNSMDAVADRDFVLHFLSQAANLCLHISRFSEELTIWSTKEFSFVEIAQEYSTGSSLMPQKKNPDSLELLRAFSGRVIGAWTQVATVLKSLPLTYNRDLQEERHYALSVAEEVPRALGIFSSVLSTASFKTERMKEACRDEFLLATDIADYLVRKGMPFRKAHEVVGKIVKICEQTGKNLSELSLEDLKSVSDAFDKGYYQIFDINVSIESKNVYGGTSKESVLSQIEMAEKVVEREREWVEEQKNLQKEVFEKLFGNV